MFPLARLVAMFHDEHCRDQNEWHQDGDDRDIQWIHQSFSSGFGPDGSGSVETSLSTRPVVGGLTGFAVHGEMTPTSRPTVVPHGNLMAHLKVR